jgi:hypothetical protein
LRHTVLPDIEYIDGEHTGYARLQGGIVHRRRLIYIRPSYWIVLDDLLGQGMHENQFLYHFAPETQLMIFGDEPKGEVDCCARINDAGLQMFLYGSGPVQAEAICGQLQPIQGWSSRRYGERNPSPLLKATMRAAAPASMMSFLIPGCEPASSRRLEVQGGRSPPLSVMGATTMWLCSPWRTLKCGSSTRQCAGNFFRCVRRMARLPGCWPSMLDYSDCRERSFSKATRLFHTCLSISGKTES